MTIHFLRLKNVLAVTGLGRSTVYDLIKKNKFPNAVNIGARSVAWRSDDIESWLESRPYIDRSSDKV